MADRDEIEWIKQNEPEKLEEPIIKDSEPSMEEIRLIPTNFKKELISIKGIGNKTAEDIIRIYPTKEALIGDIKDNKHLPFQDDIETKLKEYFN